VSFMDVFKEKVALFFFYFKSIFGYFHNIVTGGDPIKSEICNLQSLI